VSFVSATKLQFHLVSTVLLILKQQIETTCSRLYALLLTQLKIAKAKDRGVFCDKFLNPSLI
jgi:hypothetical protein